MVTDNAARLQLSVISYQLFQKILTNFYDYASFEQKAKLR